MTPKPPSTGDTAARRRARQERRWDRPLSGPGDRLRAWLDMIFVDHGIFRVIYLNRHRIGPQAWRAAQPTPGQLAWFARQGVKTVISLRGGLMFGSLPLEREACERLGLDFRIFRMWSRDLPERDHLLDFIALIRDVEKPVLYHCKSGADRAGYAAALHAHFVDGVPVEQARQQLSIRYGHFRQARTGVLDAFFDAYLRERGDRSLTLEDWIRTEYDPKRIKADFKEERGAGWLVDRILKRE